jgi:uncharacterized phiE125 gp8 family phage protein
MATNLIDVSFSNEGNEVIDLTYVKSFASISTATHDVLLNNLIKSARIEIEKVAQISIVTKTVRAEWSEAYGAIKLPNPKILTITTVTDGDEVAQVLDTNYKVRGGEKKTIYGDFPNGLIATYTAGYGNDTPEDLKMCIAKHVLENFEQRTGIAAGQSSLLPNNWRVTALNYRPTWIMF